MWRVRQRIPVQKGAHPAFLFMTCTLVRFRVWERVVHIEVVVAKPRRQSCFALFRLGLPLLVTQFSLLQARSDALFVPATAVDMIGEAVGLVETLAAATLLTPLRPSVERVVQIHDPLFETRGRNLLIPSKDSRAFWRSCSNLLSAVSPMSLRVWQCIPQVSS